MRIGILTFHKSINYGSVLQAFALQSKLQSLGYDVSIIDYEPEKYLEMTKLFLTNGSVYQNLNILPIAFFQKHKQNMFKRFRSNRLNLSENTYYYNSDFRELNNNYDCIICGSDQIWNVAIKDCDDVYFLPGINIKKIAYSISVGNSGNALLTSDKELAQWINEFSSISVREKETIDIIRELIGYEKSIQQTLDPTLLLDKETYLKYMSHSYVSGDYIFLYNIWNGSDGFEIAETISEKLGMPVYAMLPAKNLTGLLKIKNHSIKFILYHSKPEDFLSLIQKASFVITDSFHGTAFSLIFEKQFISVNYKKDEHQYKNDVRIINILGLFNLNDRYISKYDDISIINSNQVDYDVVTPVRKQLAENSIDILVNAIENGQK